ncbi:chromodomain-helicase-DNA-binding protein 4 [Apostasia shenzhenica]|uniref:Chromodomain-helicase-DNA-binding protein 4 n=1 Tax=Apostasia shenzhenica TaxID=1088818 RepID=A0A2I0AXJ6_9ASPA|nr:chromodomain-helicase-DNA-binding protein 4 [Apostasia shenzhenica]
MGSWHLGKVIDCGKCSRLVELAYIWNEDNCSKLVESVFVSAAVEGLTKVIPRAHRNQIRPLPPNYEIHGNAIRYGFCVDAFINDAWWEGVVFDRSDGLSERLIFFPDQGDQQIVTLEKLRITQEWNEVSGQWKPRGEWLFLQVLQDFEQQSDLPVSVREIWYDLRCMAAFSEKICVWNLGSKSTWHLFVTQIIQELQSVVNSQTVAVSIPSCKLNENPVDDNCFDNSLIFLPSPDGNNLQRDVGLSSGIAVSVRNEALTMGLEDHSPCHTPYCENHVNRSSFNEDSQVCGEHVLPFSSVNKLNKRKDYRPYVKICDSGSKLYAAIDGRLYDNHSKLDCCKEGSLTYHCSASWQPLDFEAEKCAEAVFLYLALEDDNCQLKISEERKKMTSTIRLKVKRHLIASGWKIEATRSYGGSLRVRFLSPQGQLYYSLRKACFGLLSRQTEKSGKWKWKNCKNLDELDCSSTSYDMPSSLCQNVVLPVNKKRRIEDSNHITEIPVHNKDTTSARILKRKCRLLPGITDSDDMMNSSTVKEESNSVHTVDNHIYYNFISTDRGNLVSKVLKQELLMTEDIEPGHFPGAVAEYINYIDSIRGITTTKHHGVNLIRLNAKKHLLFTGWRILKTQSETTYVSSSGQTFRSLYLACKACSEDKSHGNDTSRVFSNGSTRRKLQYQGTGMEPVHVKKKLLKGLCNNVATVSVKNLQETKNAQPNDVDQGFNDFRKFTEFTTFCSYQVPSREIRRSKKRKVASSSASRPPDQRSLKHSSCGFSGCGKLEKERSSLAFVRKRNYLTNGSSHHAHQSSKRSQEADVSSLSRVSRTVLSLLIENDVVLPRQKVSYIRQRDGHVMLEGRITREGIKCKCCSKVYSLSNFEAHAGSTLHRPAANIFLKDGRSLLQCQMQMLSFKLPKSFQRTRQKSDFSSYQSDSICSVCHDGGSLVLCDHCPSSFHLDCVGLEDVPPEKWFCPSCRCHFCGLSDFNPNTEQFTEKTVLYCDQCEHEYHVGCLRERGWKDLQSCPPGNWFCSKSCFKISSHLRELLGIPKPTTVDGLSFTLLRSGEDFSAGFHQDSETLAECHSKLCVALKVLHECFVTITEPRTHSDLVADIVFNKESELKRLNFYGFYTMLLEKEDELISVATFRVYGEKIAEMPLVGTRVKYRRQGMCRLLVNELEKLLLSLGVERLLLPAVPQLLETWTTSFGFSKMNNSDRLKFLDYTLLNFQDTTMCQKILKAAAREAHSEPQAFSDSIPVNVDLNTDKQALPGLILALPCYGANTRPSFTENETYGQLIHQTSYSHSESSNRFEEVAGQAMEYV